MSQFQAKDIDGNVIIQSEGNASENQFWVGRVFLGATITTVEELVVVPSEGEMEVERRETRATTFADTLDRMNPVWFSTLTDDQQTRLGTWRQEWLDYPASNTKPTTDVSDIFT